MNGLEAIELMKQGKMVIECSKNEPFILKIENGCVYFKPSYEKSNWHKNVFFDFTSEYEEYIEPKHLTGWEHSCYKGSYFYIHSNGVSCDTDTYNNFDKKRIDNANYFSTKEKAEEINFKQTLFRKLQRFSDENGGNEIDWCNQERKFFICYNYNGKNIAISFINNCKDFGQVYFNSEEVAKQAIELFHDDLIKYFTGNFGGKA
ncbi:hypothetical protein [Turicibacter sanguinis]|uniref:hypothetical protein n=1 Tax=Turicibacter sanguinis TaxID=154288 RepID=UPI002941DD3D|nr:hypothetical protein [Turicibacter sanguinis]